MEESGESKKRRKSFADLGSRMKKVRTDDLVNHIQEFVSKECPELSLTQLLDPLCELAV